MFHKISVNSVIYPSTRSTYSISASRGTCLFLYVLDVRIVNQEGCRGGRLIICIKRREINYRRI